MSTMRSTMPFVEGRLILVVRWSISAKAQAYPNSCAEPFSGGDGRFDQCNGCSACARHGELTAAAVGLEPLAHQQRLGQHCVDFARKRLSEGRAAMRENGCGGLRVQVDISKPEGALDGTEEIPVTFHRLNFGNIDVKAADRVALNFIFAGLSP